MKEELVQVVRRIESYGCRCHDDPDENRPGCYPSGGNMERRVSQSILVVHLLLGADKCICRPVAKTHGTDTLVDAPCLFAATVFEKLLVCPAVSILHILVAIVNRVFRRYGLAHWHCRLFLPSSFV